MSLISHDLVLRAAGLASSLTLIETVLAYSTGYVPIENFPWIVAASLLVALVALAVEAVVSRLRPDHWATVSVMPLTPVFLFAMRGQTDPTQIDVAWAFPVRVVATVALALLVLWMLKRRNPSPRRLALIQFFAVTISALLFLVRTVRLSALSLVRTVTVTTVREDVGNIGTDWAAVIVAAGTLAGVSVVGLALVIKWFKDSFGAIVEAAMKGLGKAFGALKTASYLAGTGVTIDFL